MKKEEEDSSRKSDESQRNASNKPSPKTATGRPDIDATRPRDIGPVDNGERRGESL